jgi:OPT family oligopeptide transporter
VWQTAYLPINVSQLGDRFGNEYEIFNILTPDATLNVTAYAEYSPVYLSAAFSMTFMLSFALATALLVHTFLHHGPRIWKSIARQRTETDDVHDKLMRRYPTVPDWWFIALFAVVFAVSIVTIEVYHTDLPVWGLIISVLLPSIYVVPAAFIYAMTGQQVSINILAELIPGYLLAGKPLPGMVRGQCGIGSSSLSRKFRLIDPQIAKTYSVQALSQGLSFLQDQKLGHYIKVPPRATFIAQLVAAAFASLVQVGTKQLLFATVKDMCSSTQANLLTCAKTKVFFTSSVIWCVHSRSVVPQAAPRFFSQLTPLAGDLLVRNVCSLKEECTIRKRSARSLALSSPSRSISGFASTLVPSSATSTSPSSLPPRSGSLRVPGSTTPLGWPLVSSSSSGSGARTLLGGQRCVQALHQSTMSAG